MTLNNENQHKGPSDLKISLKVMIKNFSIDFRERKVKYLHLAWPHILLCFKGLSGQKNNVQNKVEIKSSRLSYVLFCQCMTESFNTYLSFSVPKEHDLWAFC